jgi:hypothetical protein
MFIQQLAAYLQEPKEQGGANSVVPTIVAMSVLGVGFTVMYCLGKALEGGFETPSQALDRRLNNPPQPRFRSHSLGEKTKERKQKPYFG